MKTRLKNVTQFFNDFQDMPIVIVGNKLDKEREIERLEVEATVQCDWENGYAKKLLLISYRVSKKNVIYKYTKSFVCIFHIHF